MFKKLILGIIFAVFALTTQAETYKIYLSNQAGTGPDIFARKLAEEAEKLSNHKFIILNRPGGEFITGYREFISNNSGKALFQSLLTTHVIPYVQDNNLNIDPLKDSKPVIMGIKLNYLLVVPKNSSIKSVADIKGKINIGYSGNLAPLLLATLNLDKDVQLVPFKSDTESYIPLINNDIQVGQYIHISVPKTHSEELRVIGDFNKVLSGFIGIHASKDISDEEVLELNKLFNKVLDSKEFKELVKQTFNTTVIGGSPEKFKNDLDFYRTQLERIKRNVPVH